MNILCSILGIALLLVLYRYFVECRKNYKKSMEIKSLSVIISQTNDKNEIDTLSQKIFEIVGQ